MATLHDCVTAAIRPASDSTLVVINFVTGIPALVPTAFRIVLSATSKYAAITWTASVNIGFVGLLRLVIEIVELAVLYLVFYPLYWAIPAILSCALQICLVLCITSLGCLTLPRSTRAHTRRADLLLTSGLNAYFIFSMALAFRIPFEETVITRNCYFWWYWTVLSGFLMSCMVLEFAVAAVVMFVITARIIRILRFAVCFVCSRFGAGQRVNPEHEKGSGVFGGV